MFWCLKLLPHLGNGHPVRLSPPESLRFHGELISSLWLHQDTSFAVTTSEPVHLSLWVSSSPDFSASQSNLGRFLVVSPPRSHELLQNQGKQPVLLQISSAKQITPQNEEQHRRRRSSPSFVARDPEAQEPPRSSTGHPLHKAPGP